MARAVRGETLHLLAAGGDFTVTIVNSLKGLPDKPMRHANGHVAILGY